MTDSKDQSEQFVTQVRQTLDQSVETLDPVVCARLRAARQRALAQPQRAGKLTYTGWAFAGAAAVALVIAMVVPRFDNSDAGANVYFVEDVQLLSGGDDLELYDDLEFYRWLENTQQG
jgi:hypothetical protein